MNAKEERAAKKRLKGRVWQADGYPKPHLRGTSTTDYRVEELGNPPSPRAENVDGWNTFGWGRKPHRYDPDLEWQDGDEEWSPYIDETKRVRIVGRKRHAEFQRQERA